MNGQCFVTMKPMRAGAGGHARLRAEKGEARLELRARGLGRCGLRAYWLCGGERRLLGGAPANARGEAVLTAKLPARALAPERPWALLVTTDAAAPAPLMLGLCGRQSAQALLDAKNALLALCERGGGRGEGAAPCDPPCAPPCPKGDTPSNAPAAREDPPAPLARAIRVTRARPRRRPDREAQTRAAVGPVAAPAPVATPAPVAPVAPTAPPSAPIPPEARFPAIDPETRVQATDRPAPAPPPQIVTIKTKPPESPEPLALPRLPALRWPPHLDALRQLFDRLLPAAPLNLPGWRFVRAAEGLHIGYLARDGRVARVAYAFWGDPPPCADGAYQPMTGRDGAPCRVMFQTCG